MVPSGDDTTMDCPSKPQDPAEFHVKSEKAAMKWFKMRRMDFIAWRLTHKGDIRRSHLMITFGISMPQASEDLGTFDKLHPGTMVYDTSLKCYIAETTKPARPFEVDKRGRLVFVIG